MGYGMYFVHNLMGPALEAINWYPPRITTTAFMFYLRGWCSGRSQPVQA